VPGLANSALTEKCGLEERGPLNAFRKLVASGSVTQAEIYAEGRVSEKSEPPSYSWVHCLAFFLCDRCISNSRIILTICSTVKRFRFILTSYRLQILP